VTDLLVSCIVPVYNGESYLDQALNSMLGQTYRPLEVIAVDDGSTDGTAKLVADYGNRVRYLSQPNSGHAAARNLGIREAKGEYVAFLDADDLWHPEKLARQVARFEARPGLDLSITHVQNFWVQALLEEWRQYRDQRRAQPVPGYSTITLLARRAAFERVGTFDPTLRHGDDTEWFMRARDQGLMIELLPDVLAYRRLHEQNRSRLLISQSRREYARLLKARLDRQRSRACTEHGGRPPEVSS
jgi:glycosyltransferase involved in cell wall biosynthesis